MFRQNPRRTVFRTASKLPNGYVMTMAGQNRSTQVPPATAARLISAEPELVITRLIGAPPEVVFKAWTDPLRLIQWFGPRNFTIPVCELDVKPGGEYRIHLWSPEGIVYPLKGVYRAVVEPVRIVFTQNWEEHPADWQDTLRQHAGGVPVGNEAVLTVTFEDHDGKTKLTIHVRFESMSDRDAMQKVGMVEGWTESLKRLDEHLIGG